ncbi:hypothetical protein GOBAR_AA29626 [Gossypium barbadense]|uniref:Uncharacterized protein n=1 Tax=Gossypium barbadense TaxID=3634 RepID=A0A2P5WJ11_GOSBA|nr:hypothetical protein GOBAR_AA29626 [Gossypium barbadense]
MEPHSNPCHKNRSTHEDQKLQIDELDEWRTNVKEKPKTHEKSKRHHNERKDETKRINVGDKILLDKKDPRFDTLEHNADEATPFTVMNIFPHEVRSFNSSIHRNHANERFCKLFTICFKVGKLRGIYRFCKLFTICFKVGKLRGNNMAA